MGEDSLESSYVQALQIIAADVGQDVFAITILHGLPAVLGYLRITEIYFRKQQKYLVNSQYLSSRCIGLVCAPRSFLIPAWSFCASFYGRLWIEAEVIIQKSWNQGQFDDFLGSVTLKFEWMTLKYNKAGVKIWSVFCETKICSVLYVITCHQFNMVFKSIFPKQLQLTSMCERTARDLYKMIPS